MDFFVAEAGDLESELKYDFLISNSVFQYFSQSYAAKVLSKMIEKSSLGVAILDGPDLATKEESEALKRAALSPAEYEKKICRTSAYHYAKDWFREQANAYDMTCDVFDGRLPNYSQNNFRFNVVMLKLAL